MVELGGVGVPPYHNRVVIFGILESIWSHSGLSNLINAQTILLSFFSSSVIDISNQIFSFPNKL